MGDIIRSIEILANNINTFKHEQRMQGFDNLIGVILSINRSKKYPELNKGLSEMSGQLQTEMSKISPQQTNDLSDMFAGMNVNRYGKKFRSVKRRGSRKKRRSVKGKRVSRKKQK